ncbi:hypothetical protein [Segetibacter sp.]|uniref:hypothetical protein n=1 Tax=Segetibacter sp. TaxID=2231182 RepID=UPI0026169534|nr:hypothetical protein [Segetibacter sp.]MCW3080966.1 hypothetical protein [Segetibacter sp.]
MFKPANTTGLSEQIYLVKEAIEPETDPKQKPEVEPEHLPSEDPGQADPDTEEDDDEDDDDPFTETEIGDDPDEIEKKTTIF